ncbi:MAG TPA: toll/interleukin-1 receptor domain-containing protein [Thermoanaerobaculia bacterium]
MSPARLFISHSAREDPDARALIQRIHRELNGPDLEVLVDWKCLESGQDWHEGLIDWMLECHGAILVLSSRALQRDWVAREATILDLRKREDPEFELIPVYLPGVDDSTLKDSAKSRLTPLDLPRLQAKRADDVDVLLEDLREKAARLKLRWGKVDPRRRLLRDVAAILQKAHVFGLENLASDLDADLKSWLWGERMRNYLTLALAFRMATLELSRVVWAFESLTSYYDLTQACDILNRLAPLRVNAEAADLFARVAEGKGSAAGIRFNAVELDTVRLYAHRALGRLIVDYRFVEVTNSDAGNGPGRLRQEILDALLESAGTDDLEEAKEELTDRDRPLLVVIVGQQPDWKVLQEIGGMFPTVTFCCLTGPQLLEAPGPDELQAVERLRPVLEPGEEERLLKPYRRALGRLHKAWVAPANPSIPEGRSR